MIPKTVAVLSTNEARSAIRSAGLRATSGRVMTLVFLARAAEPVTHKSVLEAFGEGDRVTVWRNLFDLARAGLATRADLGDHLWRYWYGAADRFGLLTGLRNVQIRD